MKYFLLGLLLVTGIEAGVYWHYDSILQDKTAISPSTNTKTSHPENKTNVNNSNTKNSLNANTVLAANVKVKLIAISDNRQFAAYVTEQNKLHVINVKTQEDIFSASEENDMVYLKWIRNDSLFVGLKSTDNTLILKTFQVGSQQERTIKTFTGVTSTSTFKSIVYSPYTNDVYTLIGNDNVSKLYHFDTNGSMNPVYLNQSFIDNPMMLATKNDLYFSDNRKNIWLSENSIIKKIKTNAIPLSVYDDLFYYGELDQEGKVSGIYVIDQGNAQEIYSLSTPVNPEDIVIKKDGSVFLVNGDTYFNTKTNKTYSLPSDAKIEVENNTIFTITKNKTYFVQE